MVNAMTIKMKLCAGLLIGLGLTFYMPPAYAQTATPASPASTPASAQDQAAIVVKNFYTRLETVMKRGDQLGFAGRYKELAPAIQNAFNLPLMTRFAVGPVWAKATPQEQQELVSAFSDFSVANYAKNFSKYDGEQFTVSDVKPATGGGVIVETKLRPKEGDAVALNYLMRPDEKGDYRIVDVYMGGAISELATRRAEFSSIVNRDGINALVNTLDQKSKEMGPS